MAEKHDDRYTSPFHTSCFSFPCYLFFFNRKIINHTYNILGLRENGPLKPAEATPATVAMHN
jgi:hypothetical protein